MMLLMIVSMHFASLSVLSLHKSIYSLIYSIQKEASEKKTAPQGKGIYYLDIIEDLRKIHISLSVYSIVYSNTIKTVLLLV